MRDAGSNVAGENEECIAGAFAPTGEVNDGFVDTSIRAVIEGRLPGCVSLQELITDDGVGERARRGCG